MVNTTHARPIRVAWRDAEGSRKVPVGYLHRIVTRDPPFGLALLRRFHDWETSRVVSGVWVTSRHFRSNEWARMQEVGYAGGGGDEGLWGSIGGGGVSDEEDGGASTTTAPTPPPSQARSLALLEGIALFKQVVAQYTHVSLNMIVFTGRELRLAEGTDQLREYLPFNPASISLLNRPIGEKGGSHLQT